MLDKNEVLNLWERWFADSPTNVIAIIFMEGKYIYGCKTATMLKHDGAHYRENEKRKDIQEDR